MPGRRTRGRVRARHGGPGRRGRRATDDRSAQEDQQEYDRDNDAEAGPVSAALYTNRVFFLNHFFNHFFNHSF